MHPSLMRATKVALGLSFLLVLSPLAAKADQFYDAGIKFFQQKKFADAARYFEESIKAAPWESNTYYYCALAYHYQRDYKKASNFYGQCVERFPGTQACNQSMDALKAIDPGYFKRRATEIAAAEEANKVKTASPAGSQSSEKDKGTIEGDQARLFFKINGNDKVVDIKVNGRSTKAIIDQNTETTSISRQQLASLSIAPEKKAIEFRCDISLGSITRKNFPITVDDSGAPAKIGNSFLDAFSISVVDSAKSIELKRRGSGAQQGQAVAFSKVDGKDLLVPVEINGRPTQMIFDPAGSGIEFNSKQAKSAGLKVDDAETIRKNPGEGPQRGEPGWEPEEVQAAKASKTMNMRMKFGPVEQRSVSCQISEQYTGKYPKFGADFVSGGNYKYDIDQKASKIYFTRK